ncbi:MAG: SufS family cysteine desulfurase [Candidatus Thiodiazotropha sp.]
MQMINPESPVFDPAEVKKQFPIFSSHPQLRYMDNAATTQCPEAVIQAVDLHERECRANISRGIYSLAETATDAYQHARTTLAHYLGTDDASEIIFSSGTTGAINLLANAMAADLKAGDEILLSMAEHHSNLLPWQILSQRTGIQLRFLPLAADGRIDMKSLDSLMTDRCRLVAITHASNVTGAITDLALIIDAAHSVDAAVLLDGAQMAQHGPIDVNALGVDFYALSGHKMFAPTGIGLLWGCRERLERLKPPFGGGGMVHSVTIDSFEAAEIPARFEPGTPPIAQAVGLAAAANWLMKLDLAAVESHLKQITAQLLDGLSLFPGVRLIGPGDLQERLSLISMDLANIHPHDLCQIVADRGIAVRGGHHCAEPLMRFLGLMGTTRASLALYNDESDVDALLQALEEAQRILI